MKTRAQIKEDSSQDTEAQDGEVKPPGRYELEEIRNEITKLSGRVEDVAHHQQNNKTDELKELTAKLDSRINELEKNQVIIMTEL
jgi:DNA-binding PadR family transcriptional regulator